MVQFQNVSLDFTLRKEILSTPKNRRENIRLVRITMEYFLGVVNQMIKGIRYLKVTFYKHILYRNLRSLPKHIDCDIYD